MAKAWDPNKKLVQDANQPPVAVPVLAQPKADGIIKAASSGDTVTTVDQSKPANPAQAGASNLYQEGPTLTPEQLAEQDRIAAQGVAEAGLKETGKVGKQYGLETGPDTIQGVVDKFKADQVAQKTQLEQQHGSGKNS